MYIPAEFYGWTTQQLQTALTNVQNAIDALTTGGKLEVAAYTQGDGSRSVTYTRANLAYLTQRAQTLARILSGSRRYRRRPARPLYL